MASKWYVRGIGKIHAFSGDPTVYPSQMHRTPPAECGRQFEKLGWREHPAPESWAAGTCQRCWSWVQGQKQSTDLDVFTQRLRKIADATGAAGDVGLGQAARFDAEWLSGPGCSCRGGSARCIHRDLVPAEQSVVDLALSAKSPARLHASVVALVALCRKLSIDRAAAFNAGVRQSNG